jgi:hypothetical protein
MDLLGYPPYALIGGPQRAVWDAEFISYLTPPIYGAPPELWPLAPGDSLPPPRL